jgi:hypothetical protein
MIPGFVLAGDVLFEPEIFVGYRILKKIIDEPASGEIPAGVEKLC